MGNEFKIPLKILLNVIVIIFLYYILEVITFTVEVIKSHHFCANDVSLISYLKNSFKYSYRNKYNRFDEIYKTIEFRPIVGNEYVSKKPIVIFGCSFAYGSGLKENELFSYLLSEYTKRKVYNRAYWGWGPQNMLYQLKRKISTK